MVEGAGLLQAWKGFLRSLLEPPPARDESDDGVWAAAHCSEHLSEIVRLLDGTSLESATRASLDPALWRKLYCSILNRAMMWPIETVTRSQLLVQRLDTAHERIIRH